MKKLVEAYKKLNEQEKIKFYIFLLKEEKSNTNEIKKINTPDLKEFFAQGEHSVQMAALFNKFHEEEGDDQYVYLLLSAFQSIPDNILSIQKKAEINKLIAGNCIDRLSDLAFDDPIPHLTEPVPSSIQEWEYKALSKSPLDMAEYIILVIGLMSSKNPESKSLPSIRTDFFRLRYEECIAKINAACALEFKDIHPVTSPREVEFKENHHRRFFETRLAQYCLGSLSQKDSKVLASVNKILDFYRPGWSATAKSIEQDISVFAELGKDKIKFPHAEKYKEGSKLYKIKDRDFHSGIARREEESSGKKIGTVSVYSSNGGVLLSSSPNFYDSLSKPMRNRVADSALRLGPILNGGKTGYSSQNNRHRSPYVGSISGHTFRLISVLEDYIRISSNKLSLNEDINNFFSAFVAVYVVRGFHSVHEVLDSLEELDWVLKENGLILNLDNIFLQKHVQYALGDTLAYTKRICFQKIMHTQLKSTQNSSVFAVPALEADGYSQPQSQSSMSSSSAIGLLISAGGSIGTTTESVESEIENQSVTVQSSV